MTSRTRALAMATAAMTLVLALTASAHAATEPPLWQCRASAVYASVAGQNRVEPIVANGNINTGDGRSPDRAQCAPSEAGAGNTATQIGIPQDLIGVRTARALTVLEPELGRPVDQRVGTLAGVEDLTIQLPQGGTVALGVAAANSSATAVCAGGQPRLEGSSQVTGVTLGGETISLDALVAGLADALEPLNPIIDLKVNEQVRDASSLTVRALHLKVLSAAGDAPLLDVVVAESKVGFAGAVCDASQQGGGGSGSGDEDPDFRACPRGSEIDVASGFCVIRASSENPQIVVGRPFQGPSGGSVVAIQIARKRYSSPCVRGRGPQFAVVGTNRRDRITGTNRSDRILALRGHDAVSGGRGNDCLDGGTGNDNLSGSLGNDRLYGMSAGDHLNGGPGRDRLSGGTGRDTINAAFGRDSVFGGSGVDFINIATAGPPARVSCGTGRDKVRVNRNERRRLRGCEVVYVFADR